MAVFCCVLLPMKLLAYGNSSCVFCDYFSMNNEMTCQYCINFEEVVVRCYNNEYLQIPSASNFAKILHLHAIIHRVKGMFGSLDCTHTI